MFNKLIPQYIEFELFIDLLGGFFKGLLTHFIISLYLSLYTQAWKSVIEFQTEMNSKHKMFDILDEIFTKRALAE